MAQQEYKLYQVDAFAEETFEGNPAAVLPLKKWLPDDTLQQIAAENNLSETAYFIDKGDHFHLRWFTPAKEVRLCGHATLASAHVLFNHLGYDQQEIKFKALAGTLKVSRNQGLYTMDFPADTVKASDPIPNIEKILGVEALEVAMGTDDILVRIVSYDQLQNLQPNFRLIKELNARGLIVTTTGKETDIASRCFYPAYGINEDPVTGSAHTLLTPYWTHLLEQDTISCEQGGTRKGYLKCQNHGDRVEISGPAVTYMQGSIFL